MVHLPSLIQDLGVILITAAVTTLIFKRLRQPVVLGYLIAGFLVGPHVSFFPNLLDEQSIHVWAEIGVIFLLFGLGLEFSFKKLAKVGKSAAIAALFEIVTMTGAGYLLGQALQWTHMDSLFLGTILSMSSTTIIIRAFQELELKAKGFVALVFGVLIVEDLAAILIMVVLTIVASPGATSMSHVLFSMGRLGFFLLLWFLIGIYFLPPLLKRLKPLLSDETMLVTSIGLCLFTVILATKAGFSPALGAFVMGSVLAETSEGNRIEHLMLPVRDLFGAVFFVSVGMMVDPLILREHFGVILLILVVTVLGKLLGSGLGALLSGRSLRQSIQAGLSLAQIGEFSFLIAALGISLKATSGFLYPIVIAVSAVTTFTTPYLIKFSGPIADWLEGRVPEKMRVRLQRYESAMAGETGAGAFTLLWREYGPKVVLNSVVAIAITLLLSRFVLPLLTEMFGEQLWLRLAVCAGAIACCVPFLRAIVIGARLAGNELPEELELLRRLHFGALWIRILVALFLLGWTICEFTNVQTVSGLVLVVAGVIAVMFSRLSEPLYRSIEKRFLDNLNGNEREELAGGSRPILAPWDATLAELVVSPHSPLIAKRLEESALKETTGVTIAMIDRGGRKILAPDRSTTLLPYDKVSLIGNDDQLAMARLKIEAEAPPESTEENLFGLEPMVLRAESPFVGKSIRACGLREEVNGLIVGVERGGERVLNPDSSFILHADDRIWIVGDIEKIRRVRQSTATVSA